MLGRVEVGRLGGALELHTCSAICARLEARARSILIYLIIPASPEPFPRQGRVGGGGGGVCGFVWDSASLHTT